MFASKYQQTSAQCQYTFNAFSTTPWVTDRVLERKSPTDSIFDSVKIDSFILMYLVHLLLKLYKIFIYFFHVL